MHHMLEIQEILLMIFRQDCYLHPLGLWNCQLMLPSATRDLAVLARTCHPFKEPALDVLWSVLDDLSPLARCLPDIFRLIRIQKNRLSIRTPPCGRYFPF
jgi:hypothetical protein